MDILTCIEDFPYPLPALSPPLALDNNIPIRWCQLNSFNFESAKESLLSDWAWKSRPSFTVLFLATEIIIELVPTFSISVAFWCRGYVWRFSNLLVYAICTVWDVCLTVLVVYLFWYTFFVYSSTLCWLPICCIYFPTIFFVSYRQFILSAVYCISISTFFCMHWCFSSC